MTYLSSPYSSKFNEMVWSFSRAETFAQCPYKFYMAYLSDDPPLKEDKFYASYGSFIHQLIQEYYEGTLDKDDLVTAFLMRFNSEVQGIRPKESIVEKYIHKGVEYFSNFSEFPYELVEVEKEVIFEINGYKFRGFIDYLGLNNGEYVIIDHKSRDLKPRSKRGKVTEGDKLLDSKLRQLYLYAEAIKQEYGKYPVKLCFNCFKSGVFIEEKFNEEACEEAKAYILDLIKEAEQEEDFNPNLDYFYCRYLCDCSGDCIYHDVSRSK